MDAIQIKNLTKKFEDLTAVDGINFSVKKGEIFGLLGPNGAGKTTTLMMLSTLLKPTSGQALVNGFDVVQHPSEVRGSIGMVFQDPSSDDVLSGYENLKLHALMYDVPMADIDAKIDHVMDLVGMKDRKDDVVKHYSGGMRRRMEIARGLLHHPQILFLDEPTLGLDPQTREHIWGYIESLAKGQGMTLILTTHYMEEAEKLCDRIAIIDHGKIVALDTPEKLRHHIGGDLVFLTGKNLDAEKLRKLPFVKSVEAENHTLKLCVSDSAKHLSQILEVTGPLEHLEVHPPDMNDVFLHYTGTEIREEEGDVVVQRLRTFTRSKTK
jgi:ABC-2 type transport system ATP-binding protein